ncbi:hypothetical protein [Natronosalvus caseinilyticus]|uniref:hypothetical protein n=1 Tax=Natronosalvus caseinilyticus TaxID=2953747 RepID=UPI0028AE9ED2|nr:hypothetical protein [Natronosalvus caseinilyticus]
MGNKDDERQQRLDGSPIDDGDEADEELNDIGEAYRWHQTKGGYNRHILSSLMQKSVRRNQPEISEWVAYEMCRSGYSDNVWKRLNLYILEDLAAGVKEATEIRALERIADRSDDRDVILSAMRAARIATEARPSREATYLNDGFDKGCKDRVRAQQDDEHETLYDLPVDPGTLTDEGELGPPLEETVTDKQLTFGDGVREDDSDDEVPTNDFGESLRADETYHGFHQRLVRDRLRDAVSGNDDEVAAFCSWELARSGYGEEFWSDLADLAIEHASASAITVVETYKRMARERYEDLSCWESKLAAIYATLSVVRSESPAAMDRMGEFDQIASERAEAMINGEKPDVTFPAEPDELAIGEKYDVVVDKHCYAGKGAGRGWDHFKVHGGRVAEPGEPPLAMKWRRISMEYDHPRFDYRVPEVAFTEAEIEHSLKPVDPEDAWDEPADLRNMTLNDIGGAEK